MRRILIVLMAVFFVLMPTAAFSATNSTPKDVTAGYLCPYDESSPSQCVANPGSGNQAYLYQTVSDWGYEAVAQPNGNWHVSNSAAWPFKPGSGWNAKYNGDPVTTITWGGLGTQCLWSNYSTWAAYLANCNYNSTIVGDMFVEVGAGNVAQVLVSVGGSNNSGTLRNLNVECLNAGCNVWTHTQNFGMQDWSLWI